MQKPHCVLPRMIFMFWVEFFHGQLLCLGQWGPHQNFITLVKIFESSFPWTLSMTGASASINPGIAAH